MRRRHRAAVPGLDAPRAYLGRSQMDWAKQRLASSGAAWKVSATRLMMMNAELPGGTYYGFDSWQGYVTEREELLAHIKPPAIKDVVFVTGDIHTFIAGDVRTQKSRGESVALEFVGGSITSQSFGETDLPIGGGQVLKGNDANPNTPPAIIDALRGVNPWVDQADFDHHGYGARQGDRQDLRRHAQARADDQEALARDAADDRLPLRGRPRADLDQGRQRPAGLMNRRPRLELHGSSASPEEAAAVIAAIEQFLRDTAPAAGGGPARPSPWVSTARLEGVERAPPASRGWGNRPARRPHFAGRRFPLCAALQRPQDRGRRWWLKRRPGAELAVIVARQRR